MNQQSNLHIVIEDSVKETFDFLQEFKASRYSGVLVIGKPGTGKTFICKHFAEVSALSHLYYNCYNEFPHIETSEMVQTIKGSKDQIVFFDDLEYFSFAQQEKYYKFLEIIKICQEQNNKIVYITQSPQKLEQMPQKLPYDKAISLALPEQNFRKQFFSINLPQFECFVGQTDFFNVSDLGELARRVQMFPLKRVINQEYFNIINGVYEFVEIPNDSSVKLTREEKAELIKENKIPLLEVSENDFRNILSSMRPSSYGQQS